jgi:plastocyanin
MISFMALFMVMNAGDMNESLVAEQKITILPDAHSDTAIRFIDMKSYFLPVGEQLTLFNDDFVGHNLVLTNEDNSTRLKVIDLPPNSSFSLEFEEPGTYYYASKEYPKIEGEIRILSSDDI